MIAYDLYNALSMSGTWNCSEEHAELDLQLWLRCNLHP
jgi:hypothetical protein